MPLMLAEHAPPDWVHMGFHVMDPRTKLYLPQKDYDLTVNALATARAAREAGVEDEFYECAEEAGPGIGCSCPLLPRKNVSCHWQWIEVLRTRRVT